MVVREGEERKIMSVFHARHDQLEDGQCQIPAMMAHLDFPCLHQFNTASYSIDTFRDTPANFAMNRQ
jgi:hypothetical protein